MANDKIDKIAEELTDIVSEYNSLSTESESGLSWSKLYHHFYDYLNSVLPKLVAGEVDKVFAGLKRDFVPPIPENDLKKK